MIQFLGKVVAISASGALAPGPLTAVTASAGAEKGWRAGLETSIGHTVVEFPLVIGLALGASAFLNSVASNYWFSIVGSGFLFFFAFSTIKGAIFFKEDNQKNKTSTPPPFWNGILLSAFNPYFIAWWIGIGTPLVIESIKRMGFIGIGLFYIAHVWLDYGWLILIAGISSLGRLQKHILRGILFILGVMIFYFGINMLVQALRLTSVVQGLD